MRYNELLEVVGVKRFQDMTASEVLDYMKSTLGGGGRNIKVLGQGASGVAIQIGNNVYKMWMLDSSYETFVKYCLEHQDNPFLPKFQSGIKRMPAFFVRHEEAPDHINYVKMEKLVNIGSRFHSYGFNLNVEFEDEEDEDERGHLSYLRLQDAIYICQEIGNTVIPPLVEFVQLLNKRNGHTYTHDDLSADLKLFIATIQDIKQLNHSLDLHQANFMGREDGQIVIIDPIANKDDLNLNYKFQKFDEKLFRAADDGKMPSRRTTPQTSPDVTESEELEELAGVKQFQNKTASEILAYYKHKLGDGPIKVLGSGVHGAAVMIGNNVYKMWMQDSAYQDFAAYALKNQNNPFLPKFLSEIKRMPAFFRRHGGAPDVIHYIKMEHLTPVDKQYSFQLNMSSEDADVFGVLTLREILDVLEMVHDSEGRSLQTFVDCMIEKLDYEYTVENIPSDLKLLVLTLMQIMSLNPEHYPDLHLGNFMMRDDQLVILDPIHNEADSSLNDDFAEFDLRWRDNPNMGKLGVTSKHVQQQQDEPEDEDEWDNEEEDK